jgi:hypothetical protein
MRWIVLFLACLLCGAGGVGAGLLHAHWQGNQLSLALGVTYVGVPALCYTITMVSKLGAAAAMLQCGIATLGWFVGYGSSLNTDSVAMVAGVPCVGIPVLAISGVVCLVACLTTSRLRAGDDSRCRGCGYLLFGSIERRCPECGRRF